ncbi:hypothetical protein EDD11_001343 [Mortierella claussenii]|nr:hypothetical protein EDD11_001343 [Mortierella claussenii]
MVYLIQNVFSGTLQLELVSEWFDGLNELKKEQQFLSKEKNKSAAATIVDSLTTILPLASFASSPGATAPINPVPITILPKMPVPTSLATHERNTGDLVRDDSLEMSLECRSEICSSIWRGLPDDQHPTRERCSIL